MKRLKLTFAALAVLIAVGGAISTNANSHKAVVEAGTTYYWVANEDGSGAAIEGTIGDRMIATGCEDQAEFCEAGYLANQFVDNTPGNGIKPGQEPQVLLLETAR